MRLRSRQLRVQDATISSCKESSKSTASFAALDSSLVATTDMNNEYTVSRYNVIYVNLPALVVITGELVKVFFKFLILPATDTMGELESPVGSE